MTSGTQYVFDGAAWNSTTPVTPPSQVFDITTSQDWTPPAGGKWAFVEAVAAGQAGKWWNGGAGDVPGGTGGEYGHALVDLSTIAAPVAITIGAGGLGQSTSAQPAAGGSTSFGSILTVTGGDSSGRAAGTTVSKNLIITGFSSAIQFSSAGGWGAGVNSGGTTSNKISPGTSKLGAGGGVSGENPGEAAGPGGTQAAARGLLKAGNGGALNTAGANPGGGGGAGTTTGVPAGNGGNGAVRIRVFF